MLESTQEELGVSGRANAQGWILSTISYFVTQGSGLEDWVDHVGSLFAKSWGKSGDEGAVDIAKAAVHNWVACGAELISFSGDKTSAEAVLAFPGEEAETFWGLNAKEAQIPNRVFYPIAQKYRLTFDWHSDGKQFRMKFSK